MSKLDGHVRKKLAEWTAAGLISPEQAAAIRAREPQEKPGRSWGILIFSGFGAVVLGLGVADGTGTPLAGGHAAGHPDADGNADRAGS
ncbi:MAG: hypothetical protein NTV46_06780 [Verrucomicrobia bacterium]|nr:hypothetical protein [Verrucomicrobiota bacterium]